MGEFTKMKFDEFLENDVEITYGDQTWIVKGKEFKPSNLVVWVSSHASRLNEQDHVDFDALSLQAVANDGDAYLSGIYHAHVFLKTKTKTIVLVTTLGEDEKDVQ